MDDPELAARPLAEIVVKERSSAEAAAMTIIFTAAVALWIYVLDRYELGLGTGLFIATTGSVLTAFFLCRSPQRR